MDIEQPDSQAYPVEMLTSEFQIGGQITPLGDFLNFINDPIRSAFIVKQASVTPLPAGWRTGGFSGSDVVVPKADIQILLVGGLSAEDVSMFTASESMIVYTNTYVVKGDFRRGAEQKYDSLFYDTGGPFFVATDAEVHAVQTVNADVSGAAPIIFIHRDHVRLFHQV